MPKVLKDNGLTFVLLLLFAASLIGHWLTGLHFHNAELAEHGEQPIGALAFLTDPQFLATVFENWESEFLQMSAYVVLTAFLFQRGSAESADPDEHPRDGRLSEIRATKDSPSSLGHGRAARWLYANSLGIVLFLLFIASFVLHWTFSARKAAETALQHGAAPRSMTEYLSEAQLWFESFQNWQSEFLSTAVLVVLSIFLRQMNSPESKAVAAPHRQTGA
ncbi:MAG: hypothetical protein M3438_04005 [Pseudomonadota bacterium]|nr:hypothetical protein [Sphingomonas sp.]MDQ3478305.1 hypothetical protein [Pseudomonadota bacterium]